MKRQKSHLNWTMMCPPAQNPPPLSEIDTYWTDEQIILFLDQYTGEFRLPNNVIADSSPYKYPPSNLPEGIWYLVQPNEKKDSVHGFWKTKGDACNVYSNSVISGWRTTFEYFEGQGERTDWLMQEYHITRMELLYDKSLPKESRSLCRVFLCHGCISENKIQSDNGKNIIESKQINSVASTTQNTNNTSSEQDSKHESEAKTDFAEEELLPLSDEMECFSRGDYLELDDLEDPAESHSSSSEISTCASKLSDESFDSLSLFRDFEEDEVNSHTQEKHSSYKYNFTTSTIPDNFVIPAAPSGSGTLNEILPDQRVVEDTCNTYIPETRIEGTSNSNGAATPSNSHDSASSDEEKKAGSGRIKKLKHYFCFTP